MNAGKNRNVDLTTAERIEQARLELAVYKEIGTGLNLFRALQHWRAATRQDSTARIEFLREQIRTRRTFPIGELEARSSELLALMLFECLDPIVDDVVDFCSMPPDKGKELTMLRDALRIGRYHAPADTELNDAKRRCVAAWIKEYSAIEAGESPLASPRSLSIRIGASLDISPDTAGDYWKEFLDREPRQAEWVNQITRRHRKGPAQAAGTAKAAAKRKPRQKPEDWKR